MISIFALGSVGLAAAWMLRERDRYLNAAMGNVFRQWLIENLPPLLSDAQATAATKSAAATLLRYAYDHHELRKIADMELPEEEADFDAARYGAHAEIIRDAIPYTALLAAFDTPKVGNAIRALATGAGTHVVQQARVASPDWGRAVQSVCRFGVGDMLNRRVENKLAHSLMR